MTPSRFVRRILRRILDSTGYEVSRRTEGRGNLLYEPVRPLATYSPWNRDALFEETYEAIQDHTLVDKYRCYELWSLVEQSVKIPGGIIEVGVWKGGTGALIAKKALLCRISGLVYLCDTFAGVVKAGPEDSSYGGGEHADTSRKTVEKLVIERLKLPNVRILEGIFPEETSHLIEEDTFRFCHIDVDVYQSAQDIIAWIWEKMAIGGIIVYDDYGFHGCDGITKHVEEQRAEPDRLLIHNINGHAIIIRIK